MQESIKIILNFLGRLAFSALLLIWLFSKIDTPQMIAVVKSADILYLYYSGAWYDPYTLIEITEVVLLYVLLVVGTIRIVYKLRDLKRSLNI